RQVKKQTTIKNHGATMITLSRFSAFATALTAMAVLTACSEQPASEKTAEVNPTVANETAAKSSQLQFTEVNPRLGEYIKTLSADEFQGRAPATKGEELTVAFLEDNFR